MKGKMIQMENVGEGKFELIPPGIYKVEVCDLKSGLSQNQDALVKITFKIIEGDFIDRFIWDNILLSENQNSPGFKIRWRAKMFLKAIGMPHNGDSFEWDSDDWIFQKCNCEIVHETQKEGKYAGKTKMVVKRYFNDETELKDEDVPF